MLGKVGEDFNLAIWQSRNKLISPILNPTTQLLKYAQYQSRKIPEYFPENEILLSLEENLCH